MKLQQPLFIVAVISFGLMAKAQNNNQDNQAVNTVIKVQAPSAGDYQLPSGTLPSVYKNKIYQGKKATITNITEQVSVSEANNTRQVLHESSGVIVSDVNNQSYYSIGIRGIGDPHESQSVLLMVDDIPISADLYGYPAAYYLPSMSSVESIEVTKTGAGLLYGSQPGGSLNYQLKQASFNSDVEFKTMNMFGDNQLFTTFNSVQGGTEKLAYLIEGYQRSGDGQFKDNSGFNAYGFEARLRYKLNDQHEIKPQISFYQGRFDEPGGLALVPASGRVSLQEDRRRNTLSNDELLIDRIEARLIHDYKFNDSLNMTSALWTHNLSRESRRQNGSGFGVIPTLNTNSITDQDFYSVGARSSIVKDYSLADSAQILTANLTYYNMTSPIQIGTGSSADANEINVLNRELDRKTEALSLALENQSSLGAWTVTPSIRLENIQQEIDEKFNSTPSTLRQSNVDDFVVLGGVAITFTTESEQQYYFNLSEGFRPIQFSETVPTSSNVVINDDLKSSKTLSAELGVKGQIQALNYDISVFQVNYENQIGTVTGVTNTSLGNVGEGRYQGLDLSARYQINEDYLVFGNSQFLNARYVAGPFKDKLPAYAPHYLHKLGVQQKNDQFNHRLNSTFVAEHYSDDNNVVERKIPAYTVWDVAGEYTAQKKFAGLKTKVLYGVNNIFDKQYYSRVRSTGIEPALERNFFAGFEFVF